MILTTKSPDSIASLRHAGAELLEKSGCSAARLESEILLSHVLQTGRPEICLSAAETVAQSKQQMFFSLLNRRIQNEPLQYLTGTQGFHELDILVGPGVLIPRPETEILVEEARKLLRTQPADERLQVLDLCAGSGNVGLALAACNQHVWIDAVELSSEAWVFLQKNTAQFPGRERLRLFQGDLFRALPPAETPYSYHMIVSNPPYISSSALSSLPPDVRDHEPHLALDGGADGLHVIRRILRQAPDYLAEGAWLLLEIGENQGPAIMDYSQSLGAYAEADILDDLCDRPRIFRARKRN